MQLTSKNSAVRLPTGVPTTRYVPPRLAELPPGTEELPLVDDKTPDSKKVQEVWEAHLRIFDLGKEAERVACEQVWQSVTDGNAILSEEKTEFSPGTGSFLTLLRWSTIRYKVPEA